LARLATGAVALLTIDDSLIKAALKLVYVWYAEGIFLSRGDLRPLLPINCSLVPDKSLLIDIPFRFPSFFYALSFMSIRLELSVPRGLTCLMALRGFCSL
jgi:hypothetical protein